MPKDFPKVLIMSICNIVCLFSICIRFIKFMVLRTLNGKFGEKKTNFYFCFFNVKVSNLKKKICTLTNIAFIFCVFSCFQNDKKGGT